MTFPDDLKLGDVLLYAKADVVDALIEWKEGDSGAARAGHVEVFMGHGVSYASRNGIGVNAYDFRPDGLAEVRRPVSTLDRAAVEAWFNSGVRGQPYGWWDIAASCDIDRVQQARDTDARPMDCSHFAAALLEVGGCPQFDPSFPKNKITPRDLKLSRESIAIWCRPDAQTAGGSLGGGAPPPYPVKN